VVDDDILEHMEAICDKGKRSNGIPCEALGLCESMIKGYEPTMSSTKKKRTSMTRRIIILAERDRPMAALKKERKDATSFLIGLRPPGDRLPVAQFDQSKNFWGLCASGSRHDPLRCMSYPSLSAKQVTCQRKY